MGDVATDEVLEALWKRALEAWEDEKVHAAILEHALRSEGLPEIAGRYRASLVDPTRAAIAQKRLDAVVFAATQMLMATKTPPPAKVPLPLTLTAFAICVVLLGWLALAVWGRR
jgi:hypothetical protein